MSKDSKTPDGNVPEYYGRTIDDFMRTRRSQYGWNGAITGGAVGAAVGALTGEKSNFVEKFATKLSRAASEFSGELEHVSPKKAGALLFAAVAAVAVGVITSTIGEFKGAKEGQHAKEQHVELYQRLNALEAAQNTGASRA